MTSEACIFCHIIAGKTSARLIYQDELVAAFHDIRPVTPVHILVVPNRHIASANEITPQDEPLLGRMIAVGSRLAQEHGLAHSGYRLVFNTGPDAGQSVFHLHLHVIGGRHMPFHFRE